MSEGNGDKIFHITITCHCGSPANKYRQRVFVNNMGVEVTRVFYRCVNCWSRTAKDYLPDLKTVDIIDLLNSKNFKQ